MQYTMTSYMDIELLSYYIWTLLPQLNRVQELLVTIGFDVAE